MIVELDPKDQRDLEELSRESGKPPEELLRQLIHAALEDRRNGQRPAAGDEVSGESFYDAAKRLGLIGCAEGLPSDLSTNPKYMEGFGESE